MKPQFVFLQAKILCALILANFVAQVPYYFHNHYQSQPLLTSIRSLLVMGSVFGFFLAAAVLFFRRRRAGYAWMLAFLCVELLFYLWNLIGSMIHGFGIFFQLANPDLLLRVVFTIGYLNLLISGYFIYLLLRYERYFQPS